MTTIAYRDGILAVDRMLYHEGVIRPTDMKLHKIKSTFSVEYAIAFAGTLSMGLAFVEWVKEGQVKGQYPIKDIDPKQVFNCLLVQRVGILPPVVQYFCADLISMPEKEAPYLAEGDGDEVALGAMYMGATAIEAVEAACHHTAYSGYGVNYIDVSGDYAIRSEKEE